MSSPSFETSSISSIVCGHNLVILLPGLKHVNINCFSNAHEYRTSMSVIINIQRTVINSCFWRLHHKRFNFCAVIEMMLSELEVSEIGDGHHHLLQVLALRPSVLDNLILSDWFDLKVAGSDHKRVSALFHAASNDLDVVLDMLGSAEWHNTVDVSRWS